MASRACCVSTCGRWRCSCHGACSLRWRRFECADRAQVLAAAVIGSSLPAAGVAAVDLGWAVHLYVSSATVTIAARSAPRRFDRRGRLAITMIFSMQDARLSWVFSLNKLLQGPPVGRQQMATCEASTLCLSLWLPLAVKARGLTTCSSSRQVHSITKALLPHVPARGGGCHGMWLWCPSRQELLRTTEAKATSKERGLSYRATSSRLPLCL